MSKFKLKIGNKKIDVNQYIDSIKDRIQTVAKHAGRVIAENTADEVISRIPKKDGWYKIYRESIKFIEDNKRNPAWYVASIITLNYEEIPAETSLIEFPDSNNLAVKIMHQNNPWTIDTILAVNNGFQTDVNVIPTSKSIVSARRKILHDDILPYIKDVLLELNIEFNENALPQFNGNIKADLNYLAQRLEYGFDNFERVPHWGPAKQMMKKYGSKWIKDDAEDLINDALTDNKKKNTKPEDLKDMTNVISKKLIK